MTTHVIVSNAVGQQFGQAVAVGKGAIWVIPKLQDNAKALTVVASRIGALRLSGALPMTEHPAASEPGIGSGGRDVFISHASEDKAEVARPLAEALTAEGVSVWFDEFELRLGDKLRERIEDGLRKSRFGVVILSHRFFSKRWPQLELDGLFALEVGSKRILPVWHQISADDVRQYSPIVSERLAVSTNRGLGEVVRAIVDVVRH